VVHFFGLALRRCGDDDDDDEDDDFFALTNKNCPAILIPLLQPPVSLKVLEASILDPMFVRESHCTIKAEVA